MESRKKDVKVAVKTEKDEESYEGEDDDCYVIEHRDCAINKLGHGEPSDDVVLVAEKGQIALRDFPHPRHLCANFPFNSTAHENYCEQCFCGLCEVRAPCLQWEMGEHCNVFKEAKKTRIFLY